jgi:hypothetical protein
MRANTTWSRSASSRTTSGTTKLATGRSHDRPTRRRLPRRGRSDRTFGLWCTITHSRATAHGSASRSSGPIRKPARRAAGQECNPTGSRPASSRRPGLCSNRSARPGRTLLRRNTGRARRQSSSANRFHRKIFCTDFVDIRAMVES